MHKQSGLQVGVVTGSMAAGREDKAQHSGTHSHPTPPVEASRSNVGTFDTATDTWWTPYPPRHGWPGATKFFGSNGRTRFIHVLLAICLMLGALVVALPAQAIAKGLPAGLQFLSAAPGNARSSCGGGRRGITAAPPYCATRCATPKARACPAIRPGPGWVSPGTHTVTDLTNGLVHSFEVRRSTDKGQGRPVKSR